MNQAVSDSSLGIARRPRRGARSGVAFRQPDVLADLGQLEALARHPAEIGVAILERADGVEAVHDVAQHEEARIVGRGGARIGRGRGVADQGRIVAGAAQLMGQVGEAAVERNGVLHRAMVHQVLAGQQAGPRRPAGHALGEVVAEGDALGAQPVEVGELEVVRAELGQHQPAPLVDDDQKDVLGCGHADFPVIGRARDCARSAGLR